MAGLKLFNKYNNINSKLTTNQSFTDAQYLMLSIGLY
jgi:hypothetical protein